MEPDNEDECFEVDPELQDKINEEETKETNEVEEQSDDSN